MIKKLTLIMDDKLGLLSEISYVLAKERINIEEIDALSVDRKKAVVVIGVDASVYDRAKNALERNGFKLEPQNALVVALSDKPGELARVSKQLSDHNIYIERVVTLGKDDSGRRLVQFFVNNVKEARKVLSDYLVSESHE
jgi:hypothetical protein